MDKYTIEDIWLIKNGQISICPKNSGILAPVSNLAINNGKPAMTTQYMGCNTQCPYLKKASLKNNNTGEEKEGYISTCMDKPLIIEIEKNLQIKK